MNTIRAVFKRRSIKLGILGVFVVILTVATMFFRAYIPGYSIIIAQTAICSEKAQIISGNITRSLKFCKQQSVKIDGRRASHVWYAYHSNLDHQDPYYCGLTPEDLQKSCAAEGIVDYLGVAYALPTIDSTSEVLSKHGCPTSVEPAETITFYRGQYWKTSMFSRYVHKTPYGTCTISGQAWVGYRKIIDHTTVTYNFNSQPCQDFARKSFGDTYSCINAMSIAKQDPSICRLIGQPPYNSLPEEFPSPTNSCILAYAIDDRNPSICKLLPEFPKSYDPNLDSNRQSCEQSIKDRLPISSE